MGVPPFPPNIEFEIDKIYNIELRIAQKKHKIAKHAHKWSLLKQIDIPQDTFIDSYINQLE